MRRIIFVFLLVALSACTFQTKHRGYVFPANLDGQISGVKTTAALEDKIGSPLARTVYGDEVWIYYGMDENYRGPLSLKYDNRTVLLVWVKDGRVIRTRILRDADLPNIMVAEGETPIPAAIEPNMFQELFNNIGRFKPAGVGQ